MKRSTLRRSVVGLAMAVAFFCQGTWVLAGTTGGLSGTVNDTSGKPIAGAAVKATSASQIATTTTDASGHFVFLSLAPDTYTVSLEKADYDPISIAGITVFADQTQTLAFTMKPRLKIIATTVSTAPGALIRAGTTSDVYSVNAATSAKVTGLGGGGGLDNAYSAIATMPGAYVPVGQMGWFQTVYIRGGDFDQVGYEVDGVPVNRSFDTYPSNTATSLGQQEVQVYTGAAPADAQGQGLAGYINQVIKTGTYPGYASSDLGVGFPTFYHKANVEVGGASPDRLFSYYVGLGGYNQDTRVYDQFDGASISNAYGSVFTPCPAAPTASLPSCYVNGTWMPGQSVFTTGNPADGVVTPGFVNSPFSADVFPTTLYDRDTVLNFHFGIPHKHDGGRDDIQALYETSSIDEYLSNAITDFGNLFSNPALGIGTSIPYLSGNVYTGGLNTAINPANISSQISPYTWPDAQGSTLPVNNRDDEQINDAIIKVQYQKNFGSNAYLRMYGYTDYSNWLNYGPDGVAYYLETGVDQYSIPADYQVSSHTRGFSAEFADQLNPENLLQVQGSYTTASSERTNSYTGFESNGMQMATLVSSADPDSGICYMPNGTPTGCSTIQGYAPGNVTVGAAATGGAAAFAPITGTCGGAPCEWLATENGYDGEYNDVTPQFYSGAITDNWDPTDKLHFNVGVRFDDFGFVPNSTAGGARNFWFNAWNNEMCYNTASPGSAAVPLPVVTTAVNASNGGCTNTAVEGAPFGTGYVPATLTNDPVTNTFEVWQPRVGLTYTLNPLNVIRASYGRYDQAPTTAFEEYDTLQQDLPDYLGPTFFGYGRTSPTYPIAPEVSNNYDLSWEHQFKGTDWSMKITPFYRKTQDQIQEFFLNVTTGFVSGLNIGAQTNRGFEFDLQKGDFSRNGLSGLLAFTYTNAYVNYSNLTSGSSVLTAINDNIQAYNAMTSACATGTASKSLCGSGTPTTPSGAAVQPCYGPGITAASPASACTAADVANPYWNASPQALFSTGADYWPYSLFPFTPAAGDYSSFVTPYVATIVLNYKHDKWAITPALQFSAGNRYGYPLAETGYDPSSCSTASTFPIGSVYYGSAGGYGNAANPASCTDTLYIPDISTGKFDNMGAFITPSRYTLSTQLSYDLTPRITAVLTLANIFDICAGGTKAPWTTSAYGLPSRAICGYGSSTAEEYGAPVGNVAPLTATGGELAQAQTAYGYTPIVGSLPFNAYLDFRIKL
ncbi:MAG TPA: TonB-dependent receptor [Candidatus Baltobacteraceae bacterium]|nr:TonB-dependent receptor [Candidatus Baltobacteraceae bacterium]